LQNDRYFAVKNWNNGDNIQANFVSHSTVDSMGDESAVVTLVQNQLKTADPPKSVSDAISDMMHSRSAALSDQIHKILDRIEAQQMAEPLRGVSTALQQLDVFKRDVSAHHPNP
jgi:predicted component of type VI protein secretion system